MSFLVWKSFHWWHWTALLLAFGYGYIMLRYWWHWRKLKTWERPKSFFAHTTVSVIIPARNEAANIIPCVQAIIRQHYPQALLEIIVVDDFSTDGTARQVERIKNPNVFLCSLADFPPANGDTAFKKRAIEIGIARATGELIITTDADCIANEYWIPTIVSLYEQEKAVCIAAPVLFYDGTNTIERFQALDFVGMMAITGAGISGRFQTMANGANLAYQRKAFYEVGGFGGIDKVASGDDILLAQKFAKQYPGRVKFAKSKEAVVYTAAKPNWNEFLAQRIRWGSKSTSYREWQVPLMLLTVFLFCMVLLFGFVAIFSNPIWRSVWYVMLFTKVFADYILLFSACRFFGKISWLRHYWTSLFIHTIYIAVVGIESNISKKYQWKGRTVK